MLLGYKERMSTLVAVVTNRLGFVDAYGSLRRRLLKSQVAILMYHRVMPQTDGWSFPLLVAASDFERQIQYLTREYNVLTLDELAQYIHEHKPLPKRAVVITFDDGYKDNYTYAYPILKKYGVPATIFVTTGYIGGGNLFWWDKVRYVIQHTAHKRIELDGLGAFSLSSTTERLRAILRIKEQLKELPEEEKNLLIERLISVSGVGIPTHLGKELILSWDEIREMCNNGITIGAHTVTHAILTKVSEEQAKYEIMQSKKDIEGKLQKAVTWFAYPNGDFSPETVRLLREAGFRCAVTGIWKMITPREDLYQLGRVPPGWSFDIFKFFISGLFADLAPVFRRLK